MPTEPFDGSVGDDGLATPTVDAHARCEIRAGALPTADYARAPMYRLRLQLTGQGGIKLDQVKGVKNACGPDQRLGRVVVLDHLGNDLISVLTLTLYNRLTVMYTCVDPWQAQASSGSGELIQ